MTLFTDRTQEPQVNSRHDYALERCHELICWYEKTKKRQQLAYLLSQSIIVVLSGLTPIIILWGDLPVLLQAIPPAVVAVLVGLSGPFQWKENYLRFALTSEALKSERIKYLTRTTHAYSSKLDESRAIENFVMQIEKLAMNEASEWRSLMHESSQLNDTSRNNGLEESSSQISLQQVSTTQSNVAQT